MLKTAMRGDDEIIKQAMAAARASSASSASSARAAINSNSDIAYTSIANSANVAEQSMRS